MSDLTNRSSPGFPPIVIKPETSNTWPPESVIFPPIKIEPDTPGPDPVDCKTDDKREPQTPENSLKPTIYSPAVVLSFPPIVIKTDPSSTSPEESVFIGQIKIEPVSLVQDPGDNKKMALRQVTHGDVDQHGEDARDVDQGRAHTLPSSGGVDLGGLDSPCTFCLEIKSEIQTFISNSFPQIKDEPLEAKLCVNDSSQTMSDIQNDIQSFAKKSNLVVHNRTHTGEKTHKCDICGKGFSSKSYIAVHKQRKHTGEKPYKCDLCGKSFVKKCDLEVHSRTHTGEKPYKCDICGRRFDQKGRLEWHSRTHTEEKPYTCDICGKGCSTKPNLVVHNRTHTGEKPYKCDICGKGCSTKHHLVVHNRTHTGEKPYKCDICGKRFIQKAPLVSHSRTHTGEKPYKCDICGKRCAQKQNLEWHNMTHTGEKPSKWDICG